jgi:ATP synthase F1 gamma subunit
MIPLARLKQDLEFNKDLGGIIDVLKVASTIQLRQFQKQSVDFSQKFLAHLLESLALRTTGQINHPLFSGQKNPKRLIVVVTSDEGFLGELNTLLVNNALNQKKDNSDELVVLGERGSGYLKDCGVSFVAFRGISAKVDYREATIIRDYVLSRYLKGEIGYAFCVYPRFVSISFQRIEIRELLPCASLLKDIPRSPKEVVRQLLIEPSFARVIEEWVRLWLGAVFYDIFFSSKLAELAARLMHLEASSQELSRRKQHLSREYFKYLHALSDKTIREISASRVLWRH